MSVISVQGRRFEPTRAVPADDASGVALILALVIAALLAALGIALLTMSDVERRMASNARSSHEALAAADAGLERAIVDLRRTADWNAFLDGTQQSGFADGARRVTLPFGETLDLDAVTAELQAEAGTGFGSNTPRWQLFAWGRLSALAAPGTIESLQYVSVWIADDPADGDDDPAADADGIVRLHAESRGPGGARRSVEATVARAVAGVVRVISWREVD